MSSISLVVEGRRQELGGIGIRRTLPVRERRHVGPFVFLDHMGPIELAPGQGIDVPPHPHIGLATVTYLFEGEFVHRDSLGSEQPIRPGDVNWMVAGRGVVHSERTAPERRLERHVLHGIQSWVALPVAHEEVEPSFRHHPAATLPELDVGAARVRVIAGRAYGATSPTAVLSPTLYVDARIPAGEALAIPPEHEERAVHVALGEVELDGRAFGPGTLVVLTPGIEASLRATSEARVLLVGGAPLDGDRQMFWNFVSSSRERIERAKSDWRERRFGKVPGDDGYVPLP
jgi:redox-sensitive bicupin YhaK (pirin superfamily)